jgi:hypothetical protein
MEVGDCTSVKEVAKTSRSTHNPLVPGSNPGGPKLAILAGYGLTGGGVGGGVGPEGGDLVIRAS